VHIWIASNKNRSTCKHAFRANTSGHEHKQYFSEL